MVWHLDISRRGSKGLPGPRVDPKTSSGQSPVSQRGTCTSVPVPETTDADYADTVSRFYVVLNNRIENRYASAEKWPAFLKSSPQEAVGSRPNEPAHDQRTRHVGGRWSIRFGRDWSTSYDRPRDNNGTTCSFRWIVRQSSNSGGLVLGNRKATNGKSTRVCRLLPDGSNLPIGGRSEPVATRL